MKENIKSFILDIANIKEIIEYDFYETCGFTFVFKSEFLKVKNQINSATIAPIGIIYYENEEYYFAPLANDVNVDIIVKNYLKFKNWLKAIYNIKYYKTRSVNDFLKNTTKIKFR